MKFNKFIPVIASTMLLASCNFNPLSPTTSSSSGSSSSTTTSTTSSSGSSSSHSTGTSTTSSSSSTPIGDKAAWTILVYMCGSNLESGWSEDYHEYEHNEFLASGDIAEMLSVNSQPSDVNIVIQTGGSKRWKPTSSGGYGISNSKIGRYHIRNRQLIKDAELSQASMADQSTLEGFLSYGLTNYPAEKTGVIFWDHGGGMFGVCNDENYDNDALYNDEVQGAFKNVLGSKKLEFVGYDACLMAIQDVAETNSKYFNYMVCSQESESGYGWDYDTWIDDLYAKKTTPNILKAIVDGFIASMGGVNASGEYYEGEYYPADQTLSYLDLTKMSSYKTAWENLATALKTKVGSSYSTFRSNVMAKVKYFAGTDYDYFSEYDVSHFLDKLSSSSFNPGGTYISDVRTAFSNLVAYNLAQKEAAHDANGLSLFFPSSSSYLSYQKSVYTTDDTNLSNWRSFALAAGGNVNSTYSY
ncbi:MAG: clostripain-related cysteine peptidase [Bacilli bacterium]|nr:clostripain-related cysteine peptidase [Bacilli bacterium]